MYLKNRIFLGLFFFTSYQINAYPALKAIIPLDSIALLKTADSFYLNTEYNTALLYYEYLYQNISDKNFQSIVKPRLMLNYLRLKENFFYYDEERIKNLLFYSHSDDFIENYIDLYASFRFEYTSISFSKINKILNSSKIPKQKKDYGKLLFGAIYLDEGFEIAEKYYKTLEEESEDPFVKELSHKIKTTIKDFKSNFQEKNPYIAGILSTIFPGAGYVYTKHYTDGIVSFFWNSVFLAGGIYMYQLEKQNKRNHLVSYGFLLVGLSIYASNIIGSYTSAIRYNNYHIRLFYQELKKTFFNTNFVEQTSGIEFYTNY